MIIVQELNCGDVFLHNNKQYIAGGWPDAMDAWDLEEHKPVIFEPFTEVERLHYSDEWLIDEVVNPFE